MVNYNRVAGQALRKLRQQRRLTLKRAASLLNTSAPVLSRKERGTDWVERQDIALAVSGYQLTPWEAYQLWTAAGFIPEPTLPSPHYYDLRQLAETLLPNIPFPAFIQDVLGYVRAWNQDLEMIWAPSQVESDRIHIVADLFSPRLRQRLSERWESYVSHALQIFYHKTLHIANDPTFRKVLGYLESQAGEDFVRKWNEAQSSGQRPQELPPVDVGALIVPYDSPLGPIEYLVMQTPFRFPQEYELIMYVPFGSQNQGRYEQIKTGSGGQRVYFRL